MSRIKIFVAAGVCLVLSVLAVFGTATFRKGRKYVRMHKNENDSSVKDRLFHSWADGRLFP